MLTGISQLDANPAISMGGTELCYGELREAAAAVAANLADARRVAVWAESTLEFCVAAVAVVGAGVPLVPINPKLGRTELDHVLGDSRPDVMIGAPDSLAMTARRVSVCSPP